MKKLDEKIRAYCEKEQISGVLRITKGEEICYDERIGFAHCEEKTPFTDDSVFTFYSMSKPFCAMGFLLLAEQGRVSLSDHPKTILPELKDTHPSLSFAHMLHHVSGLPDFMKNNLLPPSEAPIDSAAFRSQLPLLAPAALSEPGEVARYANINFSVTALAVEALSDMPYADYMKKYVFDPLEMATAQVDREGLSVANRVSGHDLRDGVLTPVNRSTAWMLGGGDIIGTLEDAYALRRTVRSRLLLKSETWDRVFTGHPLNGMGLGCTVRPWNNKAQIRHNGGHLGFRTLHIYLPEEDFDILFLSNCGFGNARKDLIAIIHEHFFGQTEADDTPMDTGYAK